MQRILVIDDDSAVTSVLKRGLSYEGFAVETAKSGAEGLATVRDRPFDLVDAPSRLDELGRLASAFNEMLASLEATYHAQKRFVSDASHELCAPLTAIQGNLELLRRKMSMSDAEREEVLTEVERESSRMVRMVADLLVLARADAGIVLKRCPADLDALVLEAFRVSERCGTPEADREREEFLATYGEACNASFFYHYARLIEILYASERMEMLLNEPDILNARVRAHAEPNQLEGIGVAEAPRGTLIHHYTIDEDGLMRSANLIIATGHNNLAMNRGVLNRLEAVIRAFDPCLSCSTHALGEMPLHVQVFNAAGAIVDERLR